MDERLLIKVFAGIVLLGMIFSLYNAVASNPQAFAITFLLGAALISYLFIKGDGAWSSRSDEFPPYKMILVILSICLIISWVLGSRPTSLEDCPISVGRWC